MHLIVIFFLIIFDNILARLSAPSSSHTSAHPSSSSGQITQIRNGANNSESLPQRDLPSNAGRSLANQRLGLDFESPLRVGTSSSTNTFTPRNTATLFSEPVTVKQSVEQRQPQQESAFHRPLSGRDISTSNQQKFSPQNLLISPETHLQTAQKSMQNGSVNGYQKQSSNVIIPRPATLADSNSCIFCHMD